MNKQTIFGNITVYSLSHAAVDAACAATLFSLVAPAGAQSLFLFILTYDVLAFSLQPVLGLWVDTRLPPVRATLLGIALVGASTLLLPIPLLAALTAGVGNALFHVGGGAVSLNLDPGRAAMPGLYVAPGAFGLMLGTLLGRGGDFPAWAWLLLLAACAIAIWKVPRGERAAVRPLPASPRWFEAILLLLLLSIAIRSLVGMSLVLPWKSDPGLLLLLTLAVVLGKALGGLLGDRFGWAAVGVSGLLLSTPLLAFSARIPALAMLGVFLFNLSMPITLTCLAGMLPGKSGFAFGLSALALILGALPTFTPLASRGGQPAFIVGAILLSTSALFTALHLFHRHYGMRNLARQTRAQEPSE